MSRRPSGNRDGSKGEGAEEGGSPSDRLLGIREIPV